jgi:hypothetical protein
LGCKQATSGAAILAGESLPLLPIFFFIFPIMLILIRK